MKTTIAQTVYEFNEFLSQLKQDIQDYVTTTIEKQLEADVDKWLYRNTHVRRADVKHHTQAICQRCGSRKARQFMRNGHRQRQLVTHYGVVTFSLPRVVCECGGSVRIPFSIVRPYQRLWDDVILQIGRWADLGVSLRQMQAEIAVQSRTQVGLRKLNEVVQDVALPSALHLTSVPPIILLDAIWVTLLADTGHYSRDKKKRLRPVKSRQKVCVLVALGLYPQNGRWGILGWHIAPDESQQSWEALLVPLEQRGCYRQRGVELVIHDGSKGLIACLNLLYPTIPHQRCAFHKLRNLYHAIQAPPGLSRQDQIAFKRHLLHQVQPIFSASDKNHARQLRDALCNTYRDTQPTFVNTLERDWDETIAFFRVLNHFPNWQRSSLRTTSLLERVNRMLRRLFRSAGAFHSVAGLRASAARILNPKWLI